MISEGFAQARQRNQNVQAVGLTRAGAAGDLPGALLELRERALGLVLEHANLVEDHVFVDVTLEQEHLGTVGEGEQRQQQMRARERLAGMARDVLCFLESADGLGAISDEGHGAPEYAGRDPSGQRAADNLTGPKARAYVAGMLRLPFATLVLLMASSASAGSIFLNGVNIDGVKNQVFNNCTVQIDAQGNVFVIAKGYAVAAPGATTQAPAPAPAAAALPAAPAALTQRYWLVTEKAAPGMSQFDIDVFINSKFVRRFLDGEEHVVLELTKNLQPGDNRVTLMAKKNMGDGRRSSSPQHYFRIVVGEGDAGGRDVMINRKLIDYKRTALETKDFTDDFYVTAR